MGSLMLGFAKQAGLGGEIGKRLLNAKFLRRTALVGAGAAAGLGVARSAQKQAPMPIGALAREKRRMALDRFGSL